MIAKNSSSAAIIGPSRTLSSAMYVESKRGMSQQPSIQNATPKDLQGYKWRFCHITQGEAESGLERLHQCTDKELQVYLNDNEFQ
ncbi:unnamed protein product [Malus baccata var. baccata]